MNNRIRNAVLILVFTAISLWFWGVLSPSILYFRESVLWLPLTWDRLGEAFCHPGGLADYVSEFIVQFFRFRVLAAILVTAVLLAIRTLVLKISGKLGSEVLAGALSFIPAFIVWAFLCIFEYRFTAAVSLMLALSILLLLLAFTEGKNAKSLKFSTLAASVAGWYICGPVAIIIPAVLLMSWKKEYLGAFYSLLASLLLPFLASFVLDYPESQLYLGADYHIVPGQAPSMLYLAMLSVLLCTALSALRIPAGRKWLGIVSTVILDIAVFAGGWMYMTSKCNPVNERIFRYDRLVGEEDWDGILSVALNRRPRTYAELCAVDLALAEKGRLLEDMFVFQSQTAEALFPDYNLGYVMSLSTDRALMSAGLLNAARHHAFEKFQSFPDYRTGTRYLRSLAEIDIARGDLGPTGKYLDALSKTMFYRRWAAGKRKEMDVDRAAGEFADTCLYNDSSLQDKALMLRRLCASGNAGPVAGQYLIAMDLLTMDLASLRSDLEISGIGGDVPASVRQALVMAGELFGDLTDREKSMLTDTDMELYAEFQSMASDAASLRSRFGNTYWYYCLSAYQSKTDLK